jgi:hypothetical protein
MGVVEKIKAGWQAWVFQGIPAAVVILGAVLTFWGQFQGLKDSIAVLETNHAKTTERLNSLTQQMNDMKLQIQKLEDRLEYDGKILDSQPRRKGVEWQQTGHGDAGLPYAMPEDRP